MRSFCSLGGRYHGRHETALAPSDSILPSAAMSTTARIAGQVAMRLSRFIFGVFAAVVSIENPAEAQNYPWCAYLNLGGGATNCGFATYQQCAATVSGIGGSYAPSPQFQGTPGPALLTRRPRQYAY